jgi:hypothetical protein
MGALPAKGGDAKQTIAVVRFAAVETLVLLTKDGAQSQSSAR